MSRGSRKQPPVIVPNGNGSSKLRTDYRNVRSDKPVPREKFLAGRLNGHQRFARRFPDFAIAQH
jgi:hypothetical protein